MHPPLSKTQIYQHVKILPSKLPKIKWKHNLLIFFKTISNASPNGEKVVHKKINTDKQAHVDKTTKNYVEKITTITNEFDHFIKSPKTINIFLLQNFTKKQNFKFFNEMIWRGKRKIWYLYIFGFQNVTKNIVKDWWLKVCTSYLIYNQIWLHLPMKIFTIFCYGWSTFWLWKKFPK